VIYSHTPPPKKRYWDEPREAGHFLTSPVLDPTTGFGGNGTGPRGCVPDGPFATWTNGLGPGYRIDEPHCIYRFVNERASAEAAQEHVDACLAHNSFATFTPCAEGRPHAGGHGGVGGKVY